MSEISDSKAPKMGRPNHLDDETTKKVCDAIRGGNYLETAAAYAGVPRSTLHDWLRRGRKGQEPYDAFVAEVEEALGAAETGFVVRVATAARDPRHWTAAAWWLERRFPDRWGRRDRVEHTGKDGGPIEVVDGAAKVAAKLDELAERRRSKSA